MKVELVKAVRLAVIGAISPLIGSASRQRAPKGWEGKVATLPTHGMG